jgi:hypothetical protein
MRWGNVAVVLSVVGLAVPVSAGAETRDPALWPFTAASPWNVPMGTGAQFVSPACDADLHAQSHSTADTWINAENYGVPVYQAQASDSLKHVWFSTNPDVPTPHGRDMGSYRIPSGVQPAAGTDRALVVVDPDHKHSSDLWRAYVNPVFLNAGDFARHDLVGGDGWAVQAGMYWFGPHAANASYLGGLMRTWEAQAGQFRHALAVSLPHSRLSPVGPILPATSQDQADGDYTGNVRMGQLIALPAGVDIDGLGLTSPAGRAVASALLRYGAYVIDGGGALALWAEPGTQSYVTPARQGGAGGVSDMMRIVSHLQCVTNNAPGSWGGGGTPLAPPAPAFN